MNTVVFPALLFLVQTCSSAGVLHLQLTASQNCILHLDHLISTRDQLYSFLPKIQTIHLTNSDAHFDIEIGINPSIEMALDESREKHSFRLENDGKWYETVVTIKGVSLLVRSTFICINGYFGDRCQHVSKPGADRTTPSSSFMRVITSTTTTTPVSHSNFMNFNIERLIIVLLLIIIALLVLYNLLNHYRHRSQHITISNRPIYSLRDVKMLPPVNCSPSSPYTSIIFNAEY